jgi:AcrR family transcriptional regulator
MQREIVEVATALFYERGYHGTSMREIAAGVNRTTGNLYHHVESKHELLRLIALGSIEELLEGGREVLRRWSTPSDRLVGWVRFHVTYHARHRLRAKVGDDQLHALTDEARAEVLAVRDAYEDVLRGIIRQGVEEDGWPVVDEAIVVFALATMCTAVGVWFRPTARLTEGEVADIYAGLALAAVRHASSPPFLQSSDTAREYSDTGGATPGGAQSPTRTSTRAPHIDSPSTRGTP